MKKHPNDHKRIPLDIRNRNLLNYFPMRIMVIILFIIIAPGFSKLNAQRLSRDYNVDLLVNQAGYMPQAGKFCTTKGNMKGNVEVIDLNGL